MKTCPTCHGEKVVKDHIKDVATDFKDFIVRVLPHIGRLFLSIAVTPTIMLSCIFVMKLAMWAIGAHLVSPNGEPADILVGTTIVSLIGGGVCSIITAINLWDQF